LLTQTLLIDPFEQFEVEKPNWASSNFDNLDSLNIQDLTDKAALYRADYLRALKNEVAQKFGMRAARGQMAPTLFGFATIGSAYNFQHNVPDSVQFTQAVIVNDASAASGYSIQNQYLPGMYGNPEKPRPFNEQFRSNNVYKQYGVQLSIPLFNGLQSRTTYVQQRVLYENAILTRKNLEYQIKNDVIRAVRNYDGSRNAFTISLDQLKAAEVAFELETERYNLGVTNFVDFTNANRALVQAQTDKAQAEYRLVFQKIALEYAVGSLKIEDLE
jgi:outer membrane protein